MIIIIIKLYKIVILKIFIINFLMAWRIFYVIEHYHLFIYFYYSTNKSGLKIYAHKNMIIINYFLKM